MLCQSLLTRQFPDVQCLPIGMPDGGRDALSSSNKQIIVFQVKFARDPSRVIDVYEWLTKTIAGEYAKIESLKQRGATRYILMTNVIGSSHLDIGQVDKVQTVLDGLPLPGQCWWRSDLDRRLDDAYDLKLHYPSLLSGADAIRLLWETACPGEDHDRRQKALRAYFQHQSSLDATIRFKQAELLPTPLFEIFADVPIDFRMSRQRLTRLTRHALQQHSARIVDNRLSYGDGSLAGYQYAFWGDIARVGYDQLWLQSADGRLQAAQIGAAELLLDPAFSTEGAGTVLEGAPGQGKSTLAQFLAQVNRVRILSETVNIEGLAPYYADAPLSLPFKIELRDIAAWIKGINPWTMEQNKPHGRPETLEGAIAGNIERYSGGFSFSVADLHMALTSSPALLILDALDEVADMDDRKRVIDEVLAAVGRLKTSCRSLSLIITSRPSAIAGAPDFPRSQFINLTLGPIGERLALDYAGRWAKARRLDLKDETEITDILRRKLSTPHMAELARNTMQLSILLSLIHLRGSSLPDKRTELYDTYVDVFLNRESEKSKVVRENRELLVDIHRFLGYYLHASAEAQGATGRISSEQLTELVSVYLSREGRSAEKLEALMAGIKDRFGALVSRVEGTWEFEVQPLREYFAARHLYDTAPYSPAGTARPGTKPDRFDGIAGNPYWLNVTRFFAGCFSKGELLDLADRLNELIVGWGASIDSYPRLLAAFLLQDWVFTQSPKATRQVVGAIFDEFGLRLASIAFGTEQSRAYGRYDTELFPPTALPAGGGAEELVEAIWTRLFTVVNSEIACELARLAIAQGAGRPMRSAWLSAIEDRESRGLSREKLLSAGWEARILDCLPPELLAALVGRPEESGFDGRVLTAMTGGAAVETLESDIVDDAIRLYLERPLYPRTLGDSRLGLFGQLVNPGTWLELARDHIYSLQSALGFADVGVEDNVPKRIARVDCGLTGSVDAVNEFIYDQIFIKQSRGLELFRSVTSCLHVGFGGTWAELELGVISGSVALGGAELDFRAGLFDHDVSIVDRIRGARRRSGHLSWWQAQLSSADVDQDLALWVLAAYTWASPRVLGMLVGDVAMVVRDLSRRMRISLYEACQRSDSYSTHARKPIDRDAVFAAVANEDNYLACLFADRLRARDLSILVNGRLARNIDSPGVATLVLRTVAMEMLAGQRDLDSSLDLVKLCFARGARSSHLLSELGSDNKSRAFGRAGSTAVLKRPWEVPSGLLAAALRRQPVERLRFESVEAIAEREHWFADSQG
jgi:hypothetical protein